MDKNNKTKGSYSKVMRRYALHVYLVTYIYLQSFLFIPLVVLELCHRLSLNCKIEQWAMTPKLGMVELRFLCTALLLNEIYLPTKILSIY